MPGKRITISTSESGAAFTETPEFQPVIPDHQMFRCIGEGAYGQVWLARNVFGAYRAIKVVYRTTFREERAYEREFRGIQSYEPISRTNDGLLDILQAGRNDPAGYYYYVMELADDASASAAGEAPRPTSTGTGQSKSGMDRRAVPSAPKVETYTPRTLQSVVRQHRRLPANECVQLGLQLTLALGHLHRHGLIHRDIKPSNIIFVHGIPKLADIGLVTTFDETCSFVGTEGFVPPEGPTSPRADLFSLGKVVYEISTGKDRKDFPEPATGLGEEEDQALEELNSVVLKACAPDPEERYQSAEEFHADLALLNSGKSVKWRHAVEQRLAFARKAGAVVAVIAALATAGYLFQRHQSRESKQLAIMGQIQSAQILFDQGDSSLALAQLAQVLRRDPGNRVASERVMASLTQRNFLTLASKPLLHKAKLTSAHFSPDSQQIATASEDHTVRLWNAATGEETIQPLRHSNRVNSVAFSPDGRKIASASSDGTACVLDTQTGRLLFPPLKHEGSVNAARFSPDGKWIVTVSADSKVRIFSANTGELRSSSLEHSGAVNSVAFSPDGQWLATASDDSSVRVWEFGSGQLKHDFKQAGTLGLLVQFSRDGKRLVAASKNNRIQAWQAQVWDLESGRPLTEPLFHADRIYSLAFSPDSQRIATAGAEKVARVWLLDTGKPLFQLQHAAIVYSVAFSPDGRQLLTASVDQSARLWDASTGAPISEPLLHEGRVVHAEFSRGGERVLTAGWDKRVKLWINQSGGTWNRTLPHNFWVTSVEFDATGKEAIAATGAAAATANDINKWDIGEQNAIIVWEMATGLPRIVSNLPRSMEALTAQFTSTGPRALIAERNRRGFYPKAWIWDLPMGATTGETIQHNDEIICAHFSGDGLKVATGSKDGTAMIWDARTGRALTPPLAHKATVNSVRFSPDGKKLITASDDATALIWDTSTGKRMTRPLGHEAEVWFAQFSPAGDKAVTVSLDSSAKVWSASGSLIAVLPHDAPVEYAEFSPDASKVVTASNRKAQLWNAVTGKQLTEPLRHSELVLTARFNFDGLRVITASMDGTAQVWDVPTGLKLGDPFRHHDWVLSARFSPDGRQAITASCDKTAKIWHAPISVTPIPRWLPELAEAVGGQRLNSDRIPELVTWTEYTDLKARLKSMLGSDRGSDPYLELVRRFLAEPVALPVPVPPGHQDVGVGGHSAK